jgi:hypothetical protein
VPRQLHAPPGRMRLCLRLRPRLLRGLFGIHFLNLSSGAPPLTALRGMLIPYGR